jgi:ubiquitin C-terminal hydrolase
MIIPRGLHPFRHGLPNEGAGTSCYMNACVTSLCTLKKFFNSFTSDHLQALFQQAPMLHNFIGLLKSLYSNDFNRVKLYKRQFEVSFFHHQNRNGNNFMQGRQEDCQEFLFFMINYIEETLKGITNQSRSLSHALNNRTRYETNFFFNKIVQTTCINGHISETQNNREYIGLSVQAGSNANLDALIANYFSVQRTPRCLCHSNRDSCNAVLCSRCNRHTEALRVETISVLSDVLIVLINLFENVNGIVSLDKC